MKAKENLFKAARVSLAGLAVMTFAGISQASPQLDQKLMDAVGNYAFAKKPADLDKIKALLKQGAHPYQQNDKQKYAQDRYLTPMGMAVVSGIPDVVDLFIKSGVSINMPMDRDGNTLLTYAIQNVTQSSGVSGPGQETIGLLLRAGANPNAVDEQGESPLMIAANTATSGVMHPEVVEMLLKNGADAKAKSQNGRTVLFGKSSSDTQILKLLLAAGADPYAATADGVTPLYYVCVRAFPLDGKSDPGAAERIKLLHKPGTSVDLPAPLKGDGYLMTPLMQSVDHANPDCAKALLVAGANPDGPPYHGKVVDSQGVYAGSIRNVAARFARNSKDYDPAVLKVIQSAPAK